MKENKRPWSHLLIAALWGVLMYQKVEHYLDLVYVHDDIFSPETWQKLQLEYMAMFCVYGCLILLFLLRFFLYNHKTLLVWTEAVATTIISLCGVVGLILLPTISRFQIGFFVIILLFLCLVEWYGVWKHYHEP